MTLEIRKTAAGNYGRKQPANTEDTAVLYIVMIRVYHRRFGVPESNCKVICYAIPLLFVYLIDPEARTYSV